MSCFSEHAVQAVGPRFFAGAFKAAVDALVYAHDQEVADLRKQIADLGSAHYAQQAGQSQLPTKVQTSCAAATPLRMDLHQASLAEPIPPPQPLDVHVASPDEQNAVLTMLPGVPHVTPQSTRPPALLMEGTDEQEETVPEPPNEGRAPSSCFNGEGNGFPYLARWEYMVSRVLMICDRPETYEVNECWDKTDEFVHKTKLADPYIDIWHRARPGFVDRQSCGRGSNRRKARFLGSSPLEFDIKTWTIMSVMQQLVVRPRSRTRLVWSILGILMLTLDFITLPLVAFLPPESQLLTTSVWTSQVYWSMDIIMSFFTGVYIGTSLEMKVATIARAYVTSWFFFDVLVVVPTWLLLFIGFSGSTWIGRLLRFLRFLRLAKVEVILHDALAYVNSPDFFFVFGIFKLTVCLIIVTHINACLWFVVGDASGGWAQDMKHNYSVWHQYLCSMHWALTQFQGTSDIFPGTTTNERAYAVVTVILALLTLCSFVSALTNIMMQLRALRTERNFRDRAMRSYLSAHSISGPLSIRCTMYVKWMEKVQWQLSRETELLQKLPKELLMDLEDEVRAPLFEPHAFFNVFCLTYPRLTRRICHLAMHQCTPAPDEVIFAERETGTRSHFVVNGNFTYVQGAIHLGVTQQVLEGQLLGEPVLWMSWRHKGRLSLVNFGTLISLDAAEFAQLIASHKPALASCVLYARRFVAGMTQRGWLCVTDLINPTFIIREKNNSTGNRSLQSFVSDLPLENCDTEISQTASTNSKAWGAPGRGSGLSGFKFPFLS